MKSMDMWFNYKAQRIEKKRMISVELRVHGIDMFREEQWDTTIRPAVLKTLGHDDNRSKEWIGTVKKVQGSLWHGLDDEERKRYERQAKETNEKNGSREHKITYAAFIYFGVCVNLPGRQDMPTTFSKRKSKSSLPILQVFAKLELWFGRYVIHLRERRNWSPCRLPTIGIDDQALREIYSIEDDTGPKFMHEKHRDDLNDVNWYGGEWLEWMEKRSSSSKDHRPVKNMRDYFLTVGPSGEMMLPSPDTHGTGSNWASPLAQLIQIAWGEPPFECCIAQIEHINPLLSRRSRERS